MFENIKMSRRVKSPIKLPLVIKEKLMSIKIVSGIGKILWFKKISNEFNLFVDFKIRVLFCFYK